MKRCITIEKVFKRLIFIVSITLILILIINFVFVYNFKINQNITFRFVSKIFPVTERFSTIMEIILTVLILYLAIVFLKAVATSF